jgi:hypothetical protein
MLVIDRGNHGLLRIGALEHQLPLPSVPQLALAHYPVRSAAQLMTRPSLGFWRISPPIVPKSKSFVSQPIGAGATRTWFFMERRAR